MELRDLDENRFRDLEAEAVARRNEEIRKELESVQRDMNAFISSLTEAQQEQLEVLLERLDDVERARSGAAWEDGFDDGFNEGALRVATDLVNLESLEIPEEAFNEDGDCNVQHVSFIDREDGAIVGAVLRFENGYEWTVMITRSSDVE